MNAARRRILLFIALAGALAWSGWLALHDSPEDETADLVAVVKNPAQRVARLVKPAISTKRLAQPEIAPRMAIARANLFPKQTWYIPPPPPPPPPYVPPPPPQAPALPFSYMGRWQEGSTITYYLTRGMVPVSARAGQVLDGAWRLEPVAGSNLNFTYLPLNQVRSLRMGD
jgi:hypothetical protein